MKEVAIFIQFGRETAARRVGAIDRQQITDVGLRLVDRHCVTPYITNDRAVRADYRSRGARICRICWIRNDFPPRPPSPPPPLPFVFRRRALSVRSEHTPRIRKVMTFTLSVKRRKFARGSVRGRPSKYRARARSKQRENGYSITGIKQREPRRAPLALNHNQVHRAAYNTRRR